MHQPVPPFRLFLNFKAHQPVSTLRLIAIIIIKGIYFNENHLYRHRQIKSVLLNGGSVQWLVSFYPKISSLMRSGRHFPKGIGDMSDRMQDCETLLYFMPERN